MCHQLITHKKSRKRNISIDGILNKIPKSNWKTLVNEYLVIEWMLWMSNIRRLNRHSYILSPLMHGYTVNTSCVGLATIMVSCWWSLQFCTMNPLKWICQVCKNVYLVICNGFSFIIVRLISLSRFLPLFKLIYCDSSGFRMGHSVR